LLARSLEMEMGREAYPIGGVMARPLFRRGVRVGALLVKPEQSTKTHTATC